VGGTLAFWAAITILWVERSHRRNAAIRTVQTTVRLYRTATIALLENVLSVDLDKLTPEGLYDCAEASLRFTPKLLSIFEAASSELLGISKSVLDHIVRFQTHTHMLELSRTHLERHVLFIRDSAGKMAPMLVRQLRADLGVFSLAVRGSHQEGQLLQRELNRWYLLPGAKWRRFIGNLESVFTWNTISNDVVVTKDWDVVPKDLLERSERHSPSDGQRGN